MTAVTGMCRHVSPCILLSTRDTHILHSLCLMQVSFTSCRHMVMHAAAEAWPVGAGNANALVCTSDAECVAKAAREIANPALGFVWTQLRDLNACHEAAVARQASVPYRLAKEAAAAMQPETDQKLQAPFPWPGYQPAPPAAPPAPSDAGQDGTAHPANGGQEHADSPGAAEEPASSAPVSPLEEQSPASKRRRKGDGAPAEPGTPPGGVHPATGIDRQLSVTDQAEARATPTRQPAQKAGKPRHTNPASALSEQAALAHVDTCMGRLFEAAVPNTLFIVPTCQGRTGLVRLMQVSHAASLALLCSIPPAQLAPVCMCHVEVIVECAIRLAHTNRVA